MFSELINQHQEPAVKMKKEVKCLVKNENFVELQCCVMTNLIPNTRGSCAKV